MDTRETIRAIHAYINLNERYFSKQVHTNNKEIWVDVGDLLEVSVKLYELLVEYPEDVTSLFKSSIQNIYDMNSEIRYVNVPDTENIDLNRITIDDVGKLVRIRAMVKRKSDRYSMTKKLEYLCTNPACSYSQEKIGVPQIEDTIKELKACPKCKSSVELLNHIDTNFQTYVLEEMSEDLEDSNIQPKSKIVYVEGDLTLPHYDNSIPVGSKVEVVGVICKKSKKIQNKTSTLSEFHINAISISKLEERIYDIEVSKAEYEGFILESRQEDITQKIASSFAPSLFGLSKEKLSIVLSIVGGSESKSGKRTNIHTLIVGDPSMGKSKLVNYVGKLMPRTKYVSGEGSSGIGLTAIAVKDELSGQWIPEAGAIVQANNGYLLLDELDKIKMSEQTKLNTALEDGKVVLDKASVSAEMKANTVVIACANPKYGKFDLNQDISKQIQVDRALRSRFDLLLTLFDTQDEEQDNAIADSVFLDGEVDCWDVEKLRKYLITAKKLNPKHSKETTKILKNYYVKLRKNSNENEIKVSVRQLEGLKRLSEAHAKLHLRDEVLEEDCFAVIELMEYSHRKYGVSEVMTGITNNRRGKLRKIHDVIKTYSLEDGKEFTIDNLIRDCSNETPRADIEQVVNQLKQEAEIFEPRKGIYKVL